MDSLDPIVGDEVTIITTIQAGSSGRIFKLYMYSTV